MEYIDIKILKRDFEQNDLESILQKEISCMKILSSTLKQYNGARDKVSEDKFAQFAVTDDIKLKIRKSQEEMVIAGRLVNTSPTLFFNKKFEYPDRGKKFLSFSPFLCQKSSCQFLRKR